MENKLEISFAGDLCLNGIFRDKTMENKEIFDAGILERMRSSDYFVCNFEGPVSADREMTVCSPPGSIEYLAHRGVNTFGLANNHLFDAGVAGFEATAKAIDSLSLGRFGAGHDLEQASRMLYLEKNGLRVALIGLCHNEGMTAGTGSAGVFSEKNFILLVKRVKEAAASAARVMVVFHGGEEFTRFPSPPKRKLLKRIASIGGVDAVICHHAHSLQGMEYVGHKPVFYSLGNFVFDLTAHRVHRSARSSAILTFIITETQMTFKLLPVEIDTVNGITGTRESGFDDEFRSLCDFSNYKNNWEFEAYRVLYNPDDTAGNAQSQDTALKKSSPLLWPFRASFYKKLAGLVNDKYRRSLVMAAINYKRTNNG